jgi:hypothetical protein
MARHWPRSVLALGVLYVCFGAVAAACGSGSSDTGTTGGTSPKEDAGQKDSTAPDGDDFSSGDATTDDATGGDDATADDAADGGDDATGNDGGDDATGDDAADGAAAADAGDAVAESGADAGLDGGGTPGTDAGDGGQASDGGTTVDAGSDASTHDSGSTGGDSGTCDFAGTWASEIAINVSWAAGGSFDIVISPGSGTIKQWLLGTRTVSGTTVTDTTSLCGIQLPAFNSTNNETYGITFPNSLFDGSDISTFSIPGTVSGSTPTAAYTTTPVAVLLGLTLANPTTATWPATISTEVDEDLDTKPGVTANVAQGASFSNVPLDFTVLLNPNGVARSNRLYVAIRQITSVSAHFTDCDHTSGTVTVPQINSKYAIDSHVIGCGLAGSATDCSANQTSFVDQNQPVFVPKTTTFTSTRVAAGTTCATVRGTFP